MNKRIMTLLLAVVMVLGSLSLAYAAQDKTPEKTKWLIEKKYVEGRLENDGTTNLRLGETLQRAEITKLLVLSKDYREADIASYGANPSRFPDVPSSHWANGYINIGVQMGMIEGHDDGTFKAEGKVTFAELCAMLVRMDSRWAKDKQKSIVWPQTYTSLAASYGILNDVKSLSPNTAVTREVAFDMFYNKLNYTAPSEGKVKVTFDYNYDNLPKDYKDYNRNNRDLDKVTKEVDKNMAFGEKNFPVLKEKIYKDRTDSNYRRDGIEPLRWNTRKDGKGDDLTKDTKIEKEVTYYAIWDSKHQEADKYDRIDIRAEEGTYFDKLNLPSRVDVTYYDREERRTRIFTGYIKWNDKDYDRWEKGTQEIWGKIDERDLPKGYEGSEWVKATVYRQAEEHTVTFYVNNGTLSDGTNKMTKKIKHNTSFGSSMPSKPTHNTTEWVFDKWQIQNTTKTFTSTTKVTKDLTVEAEWKKGTSDPKPTDYVKVTVDPANGEALYSVDIKKGEAFLEPKTPTRLNYEFVAWQLDGAKYDFNGKVTSNITLTAKWKQTQIIVTFDPNGGTLSEDQVKRIEINTPVTLPTPTNGPNGQEFAGWSFDGSTLPPTVKEITLAKDTDFVAQWTEKTE